MGKSKKKTIKTYSTVIIGGGPAGIQAGYFLNKINEHYIILEKSDKSGSFFDKYPHSKNLISINKVNTGSDDPEFNLRHDWNSLLNKEGLLFKKYSEKYYPDRQDLVKYLNEFTHFHNIKIQYNSNVTNVKSIQNADSVIFEINLFNNGTKSIIRTTRLIIATGLSKPNYPENIINIKENSTHYNDFPKDYFLNTDNLKQYKNKKVLLIGNGNSAFELGNILNEYCSSVIVMGQQMPKLSFFTHYSGNVRSIYTPFYDTFFLKSNNAIDLIYEKMTIIKTPENKYSIKDPCSCCEHNDNYKNIDTIINCTGWKPDLSFLDNEIYPIFENTGKFPILNSKYESVNIQNMYFIGSLMHLFDYKKSSGGFIHGFRYLIDAFIKINYKLPFTTYTFTNKFDVCHHFINRINVSSGLYQMFGELCDIFFNHNNEFVYIEQVPVSFVFSKHNTLNFPKTNLFMLTLEYGSEQLTDISKLGLRTCNKGYEYKSELIHPILRVFNNHNLELCNLTNDFFMTKKKYENMPFFENIFHFQEDLLANFVDNKKYKERFLKIINGYLN